MEPTVSYPNYAPPNSPWARVLPDLPAQREPQTPSEQTPPDQLVEASEFSGGAHEATDVGPTEVAAPPVAAPDDETDEANEANETDEADVLEAGAPVEELDAEPDPAPQAQEPETSAAEAQEPETAVTEAEASPVETPEAAAAPMEAPAVEPAEEAGPLRPGDVSEAPIALWDPAQAAALKERFALVLPLFVDDPAAAVTAAIAVVDEAVDDLAAALRGQHAALDPRAMTETPDTESMRIALRGYRSFLDRILAL
jgi:hypothetical protein